MKKFVLIFIVLASVFNVVNAEKVLSTCFNWKQVVCEMEPKGERHKGRSVVCTSQLYQSDDYLSIQSGNANFDNVFIKVNNSQGEIVKEDIMQVVAGAENLFYIGDLEAGNYCVNIVFDEFTLIGNFEKY